MAFPGFGGGVNLDVGGGLGAGFPGLAALGGAFGGGFPGFAGPYVPSTPLGALGGIKGDLIVPIVAVGVALFLLLVIVLAVKYALAWKLSLLEDLAGGGPRRPLRDIGSAAAPQLADDRMMELAKLVASAIYSENCAQRVVCEIGAYARNTKELPAMLRMVESFIPSDYLPSVEIMRNSAEGSFECSQHYPCGDANQQGQPGKNSTAMNDASPNNAKPPQSSSSSSFPFQQLPIPLQQTPRPPLANTDAFNASITNEIRPSANNRKPGKFRRHL